MNEQKRLKWVRADNGTRDLKVTNVADIDVDSLKELVRNVERNYPDFKKPFDKDASRYLREWLEHPDRPLREEAYCLLSNWFLTGSPAARNSTRAAHAEDLWDALFCERPTDRLTDWHVTERKVAAERREVWEEWWRRQQSCQKERSETRQPSPTAGKAEEVMAGA